MTKQDIEYRKALGLGSVGPLPKLLGTVQRSTARRPFRVEVFR